MIWIAACGDAESQPYSIDQNISIKVDSVLNLMTIDEKIGQMVLYTSGWDVTGPVMSSDYEKLIRLGLCGNIFNAHTVAHNRRLQEMAVNESRLGIPLLFGYDVIHGYKTTFPISLGEAASWDIELIEKVSGISAVEATAAGLQWTFAPMVDIAPDPRWGRISESAGEDPFLGSEIARARVRGYQGDDLASSSTLLSCVKHFAAYGAARAGRDYHTVDISERALREVYLPPFKAAVEEGVGSIMTAFNELDGVPATGNRFLLKDILRNEWGFQGFVVTDHSSIMEMIPHGFAQDREDAAYLALSAGVDMDMQSSVYLEHLKSLLERGVIKENQIDQSVRYILAAKFKLGLFDDPFKYFDEEREKNLMMTPGHLEAARKMARKSMVLLKNENQTLPISSGKNIAVIGYLAELKRDLLGSWKAAGEWDQMSTIHEEIRKANTGGTVSYNMGCGFYDRDPVYLEESISLASQSDIVVMVMGEPWYWSGEAASRTSISLPVVQTELIRAITKLDKPVVLVLLNGRPLALEEEYELVDAMLEAWYPGNMGPEAIADVLFGDYNPSGKLPVTFPRTVGQVPLSYSEKNTGRPYEKDGPEQKYRSRYLFTPNEPLFPFGYGLSYTSFEYNDITLSDSVLYGGDTVYVNVEVSNTGLIQGEETVQLYIRDLVGSVTRPLKELKGFRKVVLQAGETKQVSFELSTTLLSFYRQDMSYGPEPGKFQVFVGGNSSDCLMAEFVFVE